MKRMPEGTSWKGLEALRQHEPGTVHWPRVYIAFHDGQPAAFSAMEVHEDLPVIRISGGATDPVFRGKGLYKAMVNERLEEARKLNKGYLVVQAKVETSAPILKRLGFREVCTLHDMVMDIGGQADA